MITYADDGMSPHITTSRSLAHALNIPSELLRVHLWIVAGVAPETIPQLAKMVMTDVGTICRLTGISKNTISRKLRTNTPLTIQQGSRVYGVILALDAARSLRKVRITGREREHIVKLMPVQLRKVRTSP